MQPILKVKHLIQCLIAIFLPIIYRSFTFILLLGQLGYMLFFIYMYIMYVIKTCAVSQKYLLHT